jgi:proteic killer suppression protein
LPPQYLSKIVAVLSFLQDAASVAALQSVPTWRVHRLACDRKDVWSIVVSRNWRLTFRIDAEGDVTDLDFEDYH